MVEVLLYHVEFDSVVTTVATSPDDNVLALLQYVNCQSAANCNTILQPDHTLICPVSAASTNILKQQPAGKVGQAPNPMPPSTPPTAATVTAHQLPCLLLLLPVLCLAWACLAACLRGLAWGCLALGCLA